MTILIDSDILIQVSRGRDAAILDAWKSLGDSDDLLACSPVSVAELWHGARPGDQGVLTRLFETLLCIPIDAEVGYHAGRYLQKYHASHAVALGDALIAATAHVHEARLWTRNRKHYPMRDVSFLGA